MHFLQIIIIFIKNIRYKNKQIERCYQNSGSSPFYFLKLVNSGGNSNDLLALPVLRPVGTGHHPVVGNVPSKHTLHSLGDLSNSAPGNRPGMENQKI